MSRTSVELLMILFLALTLVAGSALAIYAFEHLVEAIGLPASLLMAFAVFASLFAVFMRWFRRKERE